MMDARTIQLLSLPEIKNSLWEQYWNLTDARKETMSALRSMGVTHFPDARDTVTAEATPVNTAQHQTGKAPSPVRQRIREAASALGRNFDRTKIRDWISSHYPDEEINDGSFSSTIAVLSKRDKWELLVPSKGGKPGVYALPDPNL